MNFEYLGIFEIFKCEISSKNEKSKLSQLLKQLF